MIITLPVPYEDLKKKLSGSGSIGIIFCNSGARISGYGGLEGARRLAEKLERDGYRVAYATICGSPCNLKLLKQVAGNPVWRSIDTIVVSGCDSFYINAERVFRGKKIVKAYTDTYGNALVSLRSNEILITNPNPKAMEKLGLSIESEDAIPFNKLLDAYKKKYNMEVYPPW